MFNAEDTLGLYERGKTDCTATCSCGVGRVLQCGRFGRVAEFRSLNCFRLAR